MSRYNDKELDGSIVEGLTDKWSSEEKRKFMEDWLHDTFLFESDEFLEGSGIAIKLLSINSL
jgi:hypothetical protein